MEKWLHCNKCSRSLESSRKVFSLTSCQHVFCEECAITVAQKCPECGSIGVSTMTLQKPLQHTLVPYFRPLVEQMEHVCQAADFQCSQARIVLRRFCETEAKYDMLKKTYSRELSKTKKLDACYEELQVELERQHLKLASLQAPRACASSQRRSFPTNFGERLGVKRAAELDILPRTNRPADSRARANATFSPHEYQPRAIVSAESSMTPVQRHSQSRSVQSLTDSSNVTFFRWNSQASHPNDRNNF